MAWFPLLTIVFALFGFNFVHASSTSFKSASEFVSSEIDEEAAMQIAALFRENFQQLFSWDDPDLLRLLSRESTDSDAADAAQKLAKRVDGTAFANSAGPLYPFAQCVGCANEAKQSWVLEDFTIDFFLDRRGPMPEDLKDKCVFYTQRPNIVIKPSLSKPATQWACVSGLKTIWVRKQPNSAAICDYRANFDKHLWPYQSSEEQFPLFLFLHSCSLSRNVDFD
jgi:hypothetical protein